ncbi:hypothetical protein ACQY0O_007753 [Thecaphora frezii]
MPSVTIINATSVPLHICLKHVSPLHYTNSVPPNGGQTTFRCGRVWFTIQARIDRGDNGYDKFQEFAPIAAVTLGALTLGAGAIYFAGASAAAGGAAAAVAAISARISALVATHSPTAKRVYRYAKKGKTVAKVGQVVGIGGGAAVMGQEKGEGEGKDKDKERKDAKAQAQEATKATLKKLLQDSVVSSPGWYMGGDRTFRIVGGPRASVVDGLLVIETDTTTSFSVERVGEDEGPRCAASCTDMCERCGRTGGEDEGEVGKAKTRDAGGGGGGKKSKEG